MEKSKTFTNCLVKSAIFTIEQIKFKYNHKTERDWELEEQREREEKRGARDVVGDPDYGQGTKSSNSWSWSLA